MLLDELHQKKLTIEALVHECGASHLRVFGSVARRQERPDSDVDFLVQLPLGYDLFRQRIALTQSLAELLHRRVDLVPEHELNQHLRLHILSEAIEL